MAGLLYLGSGAGLGLVRLVGKRGAREAPLRGRDWAWLGGAISLGGIVAPVLLVNGLAVTSAAAASLLLNLEGVATALLAWIAFREHTSRAMIVGTALVVLGAATLSWTGHPSLGALWGPLLIAAACLCWAVDNNLTRNISGGDPYVIATTKGLVSGVVNTGIGLVLLHDALPAPGVTALTAIVGFFGYGLSLVCFVLALRSAGTARTGAYFSTAPFVGAALSVAFLRSPFDWRLVLAGALMAAGTYLHLREDHGHMHTHDPLEHDHAHVHDAHHGHEHAPGDPPGESHAHPHRHSRQTHAHPHFPDAHHRHDHPAE